MTNHPSILTVFASMCLLAITVHADVVGTGAGLVPPDNNSLGAASTIAVSQNQLISGAVIISLTGLSHTHVGNLVATLTAPDNTSIDLFRSIGGIPGDNSNFSGDYIFRDTGGNIWTAASNANGTNAIVAVGAYQASDGLGTQLSLNLAFLGKQTQGNWTLWISDNRVNDIGSLGSWSLSIQSVSIPEPSIAPLVGIGLLVWTIRRNKICCNTEFRKISTCKTS